jgi:hypothetical protein
MKLVLSLIVLIAVSVISVNAEEYDYKFIDSITRTIPYNLTNATLLDIKFDTYGLIFKSNGTNGLLNVHLPKTIPIINVDTLPSFLLLNGNEIMYPTDSSKCFYDFQVPVNGYTEFQIIFSYWPERPLPMYYLDLPSECYMPNNKIIMDFNDKICSSEKSVKVLNNRDEVVCINYKHIEKLIDREYLKPTEVVITLKQ